jgi:hypothetical protein
VIPARVSIFVAAEALDLRRSFDGLAGVVKDVLRHDPGWRRRSPLANAAVSKRTDEGPNGPAEERRPPPRRRSVNLGCRGSPVTFGAAPAPVGRDVRMVLQRPGLSP